MLILIPVAYVTDISSEVSDSVIDDLFLRLHSASSFSSRQDVSRQRKP